MHIGAHSCTRPRFGPLQGAQLLRSSKMETTKPIFKMLGANFIYFYSPSECATPHSRVSRTGGSAGIPFSKSRWFLGRFCSELKSLPPSFSQRWVKQSTWILFYSETMTSSYCVTFFVSRKNIFLDRQVCLICESTYFPATFGDNPKNYSDSWTRKSNFAKQKMSHNSYLS